jgi:hypothetical protein
MGSLACDIPAGDGKLVNLFLRCIVQGTTSPRDETSETFRLGTHRSGTLHQLDVLILQKPDSAISRMKKNDTFHKKGLLNLLIEYVNVHLCP